MNKTFICTLCCLSLLSCSDRQDNNENTYSIGKLDENVVDLTDAEFKVKNIKLIPLEATDESLLGRHVSVITKDEGMLLIRDQEAEIAYWFDSETGEYKSNIDRRGKSNKEYIGLGSMSADTLNNIIFVQDGLGQKYMSFTYNGEHINNLRSDTLLNFYPLSDGLYVGYNANLDYGEKLNYNLCLYNKNFKLIRGLDPRTDADIPISYYGAINLTNYASSKQIFLRDTLFEVSTKGLTNILSIDKGKYKRPNSVNMRSEEAAYYISSEDTWLLGDILYYECFTGGGLYFHLWNTKTKELIYKSSGSENYGIPINYKGEKVYIIPIFVDGKTIYTIIHSHDHERLGIDNNDNPVVVSFELA